MACNNTWQARSAEEKTMIQSVAGQLIAEMGIKPERLRRNVFRIVAMIGPERALTVWEQAQALHRQGEVLTADRKRQRSPAATFFALIRHLPAS